MAECPGWEKVLKGVWKVGCRHVGTQLTVSDKGEGVKHPSQDWSWSPWMWTPASLTPLLWDQCHLFMVWSLVFNNEQCPHLWVVRIQGAVCGHTLLLGRTKTHPLKKISQERGSFLCRYLGLDTVSFCSFSHLSSFRAPAGWGVLHWRAPRYGALALWHSINPAFICSQREQPVWFLDINTLNQQDRPHGVI